MSDDTSYRNMALGRFQTAYHLRMAAHYLLLTHRNDSTFTHIAAILDKESEKVAKLGLQEVTIAFPAE